MFKNIVIDIEERTSTDSNVSNITESTNIPINNPIRIIYCLFFCILTPFLYFYKNLTTFFFRT